MMVWNAAGTIGYLTAIGSRKLFKVDGACLSGSCIFGPNRASPSAVEVGEGPSGVALSEARSRLYVLDRFTNAIAVVSSVVHEDWRATSAQIRTPILRQSKVLSTPLSSDTAIE